MSIKISILLLLMSFFLLQVLSNAAELFFLSKNQQSTLLLQNIIKEQNSLHNTTDAVAKLRRILDNVQINNAEDTQRRLQLAEDEFNKASKSFNIFWSIPGLTSDNPATGIKIKNIFEKQMKNEKKYMNTLKKISSINTPPI